MSNIIIGKTLLSSNTPKRGDKGILINKKYFIPLSTGSGNEFYKCTSVGNGTWSGRKAILNNGVYEYESDSTSDLEYSSITPVVGRIYNGNALASISSLYTGLPINGLIFYAPLTENRQSSETREPFSYYNTVSFQSIENIQCGRFYGSMINFTPQNYPSNNITLSAWYYKDSNSAYDATGFFGYGSGSGRAALIENQYGIFCLEYDGGRISSNTQINTNRWYHLAIAIGQNNVMFYMNGVLVSTNSYSANIVSNNGVIGGLNSNYMCNCYVAGCRIYNRLLEEFEIQALSNEFSV